MRGVTPTRGREQSVGIVGSGAGGESARKRDERKRKEEEPAQNIPCRRLEGPEDPRASGARQGQAEGEAGGEKLIFLSTEEDALSL